MLMKKKRPILFSVLFVFYLLTFMNSCVDKDMESSFGEEAITRAVVEDSLESKYYKILPGSSEWAELNNVEEMYEVSQLTQEQLEELSTSELVEACIDFPLALNYLFFTNEKEAISDMINNFNGLSELARRNDGASELLKAYDEMVFSDEVYERKGYNSFWGGLLGYCELLLTDTLFLNSLSESEISEFRRIAKDKYGMILEHPEYFGLHAIKRSLMVCAELALLNEYAYPKTDADILHGYISFYKLYSPEGLDRIIELVI